MDAPTALGDLFQYQQSKKEMSLQQQEFAQSMALQRQEEHEKVLESQKERALQLKEQKEELAVQQQGQREQAVVQLRKQDIQQSIISDELNNRYFHVQSNIAICNLAGNLQNTTDDNTGGEGAYVKANKYYNEQAAVNQMKNFQYE